MTIKCSKCGGYIFDVSYGGINSHDCKNHIKPQTDFTHIKNLKFDDEKEKENKFNSYYEFYRFKNKQRLDKI